MPDSPNIVRLTELIMGSGNGNGSGSAVPPVAGEYVGPERRRESKPLIYRGGTEGYCLYSGEDAAVQRAFLKAGTIFEEHYHRSTEVLVVLSGIFQTTVAAITTITPVAGVAVVLPEIVHSALAITDCWVIGVLIPSEVGYPHD
jgi:quercetin dioxygenase-like cupin family protein